MIIHFYTPYKDAVKKIIEMLEKENNTCILYANSNDFYTYITNTKNQKELILLDYLLFDHDLFNIYKYMQKIKCLIPLLFYNNPYFSNDKIRMQHWCTIFNVYYNNDKTKLDDYFPLLKQISSILEMPEIAKNIPLLDITKKIQFNCNTAYNKKNEICKHLPHSLSKIFKILLENKTEPLSCHDLQKILLEDNEYINTGTIYTTISRLRKYLKEEMCDIQIVKLKNGYKIIEDF